MVSSLKDALIGVGITVFIVSDAFRGEKLHNGTNYGTIASIESYLSPRRPEMKRLFVFLFAMFALPGLACSLFTPVSKPEPLPPETTQEVFIIEPTANPLPTETPIPQPAFEATT
jgi:hypothetical protein